MRLACCGKLVEKACATDDGVIRDDEDRASISRSFVATFALNKPKLYCSLALLLLVLIVGIILLLQCHEFCNLKSEGSNNDDAGKKSD